MRILILFTFLTFSSYCFSQEISYSKSGIDENKYIPVGLNVGDKAPIIESLSLQNELINSQDILLEKKIVVIFYRGKWCPVCKKHLNKLSESLDLISQKDAVVLVIGPENRENAEITNKKTNAKFILIADTDQKIQKEFDVLFSVRDSYNSMIKTFLNTDIAKNNNQEKAQLPIPATYIINKEGIITYKHFQYNYSSRATAEDIISNL